MNPLDARQRMNSLYIVKLGVALCVAGSLMAACGGSSGSNSSTPAAGSSAGASVPVSLGGSGQVLPVTSNPIDNPSTNDVLAIDSVLVENNVDASGAAVDDHLEIALSNRGQADLTGIEVFYTFTDPTAGVSESYYAALPDSFVVPAGGRAVAHFDNTGAVGHFPENEFSLYRTSLNALDVTVVVSAPDAAVQTLSVQKDAGGDETAD